MRTAPGAGRGTGTSGRAASCIVVLVGGYVLLAAIAGVPNSPLATPLPKGARPPGWAVRVARWVGLDRVGRGGLIMVSIAVMAVLLIAFVLLLREARAGRVSLAAVLSGAGAALAVSVAAPVLLSRDVFSYAAFGSIDAIHHRDPYVAVLGSFPHDRFVAVTAGQWLRSHSPYGPTFTLASAAVVRLLRGSPGDVVLAFKVLAGCGIAVATLCAAAAARAIRRERAALAAAVVGLNPVIVVHTVGGAHVDALLAAPVAAAVLIALRRKAGPARRSGIEAAAIGVTALLTLAVTIKTVLAAPLVLWLWWLVRSAPRGRRVTTAAVHLALAAALTGAALAPFVAGRHTLTPLASLGGVEGWASPAHLVAHGAQALARVVGGTAAATWAFRAILVAFALGYLTLLPRAARLPLPDSWGAALLLLALTLPYLLPWYVAWFVPLLGPMLDRTLFRVGVAVSVVLALTLIPADPFRGSTTWAVMTGAHYVAAPLLLALLVVAARHVWRAPQSERPGTSPGPRVVRAGSSTRRRGLRAPPGAGRARPGAASAS